MAGGGGDSEGGDYWPGYVDALTAMVKVLAFVMMLLDVTVFMLSQKISRQMIETIAQAANVKVDPNTNITELTRQVKEKLAPSAPPPPSATSQRQAEGQQSSIVDRQRTESKASEDTAPPVSAASTRTTGSEMTVTFPPRVTRMDDNSTKGVADFAPSQLSGGTGAVEIRAHADASSGSLTDARRVAYYRAMQVRQQLIAAGIPGDKLTIRVVDVVSETEGRDVKVTARR